jgi:hypothetical protein
MSYSKLEERGRIRRAEGCDAEAVSFLGFFSFLSFFGLDFSVLRSLCDDFLPDFDFFLLQGQRSLGERTWATFGCHAYDEST